MFCLANIPISLCFIFQGIIYLGNIPISLYFIFQGIIYLFVLSHLSTVLPGGADEVKLLKHECFPTKNLYNMTKAFRHPLLVLVFYELYL